jgi:hypothetical protein
VSIRFFIRSLGLAHLALALVSHSAEANDRAVSASSAAVSLAALLDEGGNIRLNDKFSGSIDSTGFNMVAGEDGKPRFVKFDRMSNDNWSALGGGVNGAVRALAAIGTDLYVGGQFSLAGDTSASRIAKFDTTQTGNGGWSTLGDGVNGTVFALEVVGTDLYVGGSFTSAGGVSVGRIAKYDTTQTDNSGWSALGNGVTDIVRALAVIGTDLYVGGEFSQAGGAPASRIAKYDTTQAGNAGWSALGDGVGGFSVLALAPIGADLYVGGDFFEAEGAVGNYIAMFDTTQSGNKAGRRWATG